MIKHSASPRGGGVPQQLNNAAVWRARNLMGPDRPRRPLDAGPPSYQSNSFAVAAILMIPAALSAQVGGVRAETMPSEPELSRFRRVW
jgi:hypothetical protein